MEKLNGCAERIQPISTPASPQIHSRIKEWYEEQYPTDELGHDINPEITFTMLREVMTARQSVYKALRVSDSLVRERVFVGLASVAGMAYEEVFELWMSCNERPA